MNMPKILRRKALSSSPTVVDALQDRTANFTNLLASGPLVGGINQAINATFVQTQAASYAYLYSSQPAVRTVIDFMARNVAQLGLKLFERVDDTERRQVYDHPAMQLLKAPNDQTPGDQFIWNLVADFLIHDNAYVLKLRPPNGTKLALLQVPAHSVGIVGLSKFTVNAYRIFRVDGSWFDVAPSDVIHWRGYNPQDPRLGISKLETLRQVLVEESVSQTTSVELMRNGLQGGLIERPLDAPEWSQEARQRFEEDWANRSKGSARKSPVLEEGMKFVPATISPKEAQMLDTRKFTLATVANLYGVPLGLIGLDQSELSEQHRQFYADCLPPITKMLACYLDLTLLQAEYGANSMYFEFNLDDKLRGNIEEKLATMVSVAGASFMTRNEVRALQNLPPIDGGDELITPLNVMVGNNPKPSPQVMPPQDPNGPPQDGSYRLPPGTPPKGQSIEPETKAQLLARRGAQERRRNGYAAEHEALLTRFFSRQQRSIASKKMAGKAFDTERWDKELSDDLYKLAHKIAAEEGGIAAKRLGLDGFDLNQVQNYLRQGAINKAQALNITTKHALEQEGADAKQVFDNAKSQRAAEAGTAYATQLSSFAHSEAAKQSPRSTQHLKTWIVTSPNSRHPEMDGESVPVYTEFSNGGQYPGDPGLGVDQTSHCECLLDVT